jgi:hypothetical protein
MTAAINRFSNLIKDSAILSEKELVTFFGYFLTDEADDASLAAMVINQCFKDVNLHCVPRV